MPHSLTVSLERFAVEELGKLARSRRKALTTLARSPLPGQKRHAEKRTEEAAAWLQVEVECFAALGDPDEIQADSPDPEKNDPYEFADVSEEGG